MRRTISPTRSRLLAAFLTPSLIATLTAILIATLIATLFTVAPAAEGAPSSDGIDRDRKIALLFDSGGPGDGSFNDAARKALRKATKKYRLYAPNVREVVTDGTLGDRIFRLRLMARSGYYLMIAVGSANAEAVRRVSLEYPDLEFAILNDGTVSGLNVASLVFDDRQAAYIAGLSAALTSRSRRVLYIAKDQVELDRLAPYFERGVNAASRPLPGTSARKGSVEAVLSHMGLNFTEALDSTSNERGSSGIDRVYSTWNLDAAVLSAIIIRNRERTPRTQIKLISNSPDHYYVSLAIAQPHLLLTIDRDVNRAIDLVVTSAVRGDYVLNLLDGVNNVFGRRFTFANDGLAVKFESDQARKVRARIEAEIARIKSKEVRF